MSSPKMCEERTRQTDSLIHFTAGRSLSAGGARGTRQGRDQRVTAGWPGTGLFLTQQLP
jgi:hypothetical protein